MATYIPRDPSKVQYPIDIRSLVIKSDPDWPRKSVQLLTYRFGNGLNVHDFCDTVRPSAPYDWIP